MERRIIITGANGQLGRAINKILGNRSDVTILNTGSGEPTAYCPIKLDVTNPVAVMNLIQDLKPEIIINCAAHTGVDLCESEQERAYRINVLGPKNLATAAEAMEAKLIHISTDYVFDGEGEKPYTEEDSTNPQSVYGKTKLEGENFVRSLCERHFIIRTAWLYGEGRNFVKTMLCLLENNSEIRVVYDQVGCPTSALELARAVEFLMNTEAYGTYHGVCEGAASWYDFAVEIFKQAGREVHVAPITTEEYKTPAKRPNYGVLDTNKLKEAGFSFKPWKEALQEYMEELK